MTNSGRLSHAYIIYGGGKPSPLSDSLAMAAVCGAAGERPCGVCAHCKKASRGIHPDITTITLLPDKKELLVDQIRDVRDDAIVSPNEANGKAYVLEDAGTMNMNAQNALLKLLEEPPRGVTLILLTDGREELLPTVRSRCVELREKTRDAEASPEAADAVDGLFRALGGGALALAEYSFELEKLARTSLPEFLKLARDRAVTLLRESLTGGAGHGIPAEKLSAAVHALDRAEEYLKRNVSVAHISAMLCATLSD
jgi:hypothetical protein